MMLVLDDGWYRWNVTVTGLIETIGGSMTWGCNRDSIGQFFSFSFWGFYFCPVLEGRTLDKLFRWPTKPSSQPHSDVCIHSLIDDCPESYVCLYPILSTPCCWSEERHLGVLLEHGRRVFVNDILEFAWYVANVPGIRLLWGRINVTARMSIISAFLLLDLTCFIVMSDNAAAATAEEVRWCSDERQKNQCSSCL